MIELLEKLMAEDFKDVFKPISSEEAERRNYYDEEELIDYLMMAPWEYLTKLYIDYVGPLNSVMSNELIEQLPDEVLHKIYVNKIKDVAEKEYEYNAKEVEGWAREEWNKRQKKKKEPTESVVEDFEDVFKPASEGEVIKRVKDMEISDIHEELYEYLANMDVNRLVQLYNVYSGKEPIEFQMTQQLLHGLPDEKLRKLFVKVMLEDE